MLYYVIALIAYNSIYYTTEYAIEISMKESAYFLVQQFAARLLLNK